ncbi:hypothetical protein HMPREF0889_1232 [Megasphaera lornae]|uniref:Uncharacterized protein n=1 Tax=Megasphaera lornae TaxID=1000568 RepID=D3LW90_9FIRM|nr:hypothetical protein HMPREF0889_1232 [Megasphaera genomosp. type_1 str. 28L]
MGKHLVCLYRHGDGIYFFIPIVDIIGFPTVRLPSWFYCMVRHGTAV